MENRDSIEEAIYKWWRGGGGTRTIANVLEREGATVVECRFVAAKLASSSDRLHVITESVVENALELARASGAAGSAPVTRAWDGRRCVFDMNPCPECGAWDDVPVVHGPLVDIGSSLRIVR